LTNLLLERSNLTILLRSTFLLLRQICLEASEFGEPFLISSTFLRMAFGRGRIALPPFVHFIGLCFQFSLPLLWFTNFFVTMNQFLLELLERGTMVCVLFG